MKYTCILLAIILIFLGCSPKKSSSREVSIPEASVNVDSLTAKRDSYLSQIEDLNQKLIEVNQQLEILNENQKLPLISGLLVEQVDFEHTIELQGDVRTRQNLELYPQVAGKLLSLNVPEGRWVRRGTVLGVVDDSGLSQQVQSAKIQLALAKTNFERIENLWNQEIGSEMNYLEAKTSYESQKEILGQLESQYAKTRIIAPFDGVVDELIAKEGSYVSPGMTPILRLVNLNSMYVEADAPENYILSVVPGSDVIVKVDMLQREVKTKLRQTGNYINPNNRTFRVEAPIPNPDGLIKPNLTAKLIITDYRNPDATVIPLRLIHENAIGQSFVYRMLATDEEDIYIAEKVFVELGIRSNNLVEILDGINLGDLLVDEGSAMIEENQKVKRLNS